MTTFGRQMLTLLLAAGAPGVSAAAEVRAAERSTKPIRVVVGRQRAEAATSSRARSSRVEGD